MMFRLERNYPMEREGIRRHVKKRGNMVEKKNQGQQFWKNRKGKKRTKRICKDEIEREREREANKRKNV